MPNINKKLQNTGGKAIAPHLMGKDLIQEAVILNHQVLTQNMAVLLA
jgi:hypothetical protein